MTYGKLYGIGAGPGDPELLTIRAVNAIRKSDVVAVPKTGGGEGAALSIVREYIGGKELLECGFSMDRDIDKRMESRKAAAAIIIDRLQSGKNVAFITLGDPTTYSTYMYVHRYVAHEGFLTEIIPGVTSYSAAAALFGIALCEGGETLTIIPARSGEDIDALLAYPGNKVIMKSGENLLRALEALKERGYGDRTKIASRVAMDGQRLFHSIDEFVKSPETGYFTLAIVKDDDYMVRR
jgi:precorrin-2/cobalt-factor-2 C20-methyltransferase